MTAVNTPVTIALLSRQEIFDVRRPTLRGSEGLDFCRTRMFYLTNVNLCSY
jgi:hypothetical protein